VADSALVIHEGAGAGLEHPVQGELILGRQPESADLVLDDPGVSRRHARVVGDRHGVVVEDLGSSNGTYVNGRRISGPVELGAGDELRVGATVVGVRPAAASPRRAPSARGPVPSRLAPDPHADSNIPALASVFLGPLSILLTLLGAGGFFVALPCGLAAIGLGAIGTRNADHRGSSHRVLARIGRTTGMIGTAIAALAALVFLAAAALG
jgi:hypothetical protein